jgi:hypothetical protein
MVSRGEKFKKAQIIYQMKNNVVNFLNIDYSVDSFGVKYLSWWGF